MSYGAEFDGEEPAITAHSSLNSTSLNSTIPKVNIHERELKSLSVKERIKFVGGALYQSEISGFAKGVILHKILDYTIGHAAKKSPTVKLYASALHRLVNFFELDSVFHGMVTIISDSESDNSRFGKQGVENMAANVIKDRWFSDADDFCRRVYDNDQEDPISEVSVPDILHCLSDTSVEVAAKYNYVSLYKEEFEEGETKYNLYVFQLNGTTYGLSSRASNVTAYYVSRTLCLYGVDITYSRQVHLFRTLAAMAKENFIRMVNPSKNVLELAERSMRIAPRKKSYAHIPNLPVDDIKKSIAYSLANKKRRVIALIGDPGLGKTQAVHAIINAFPETPAFMVLASAMGFYHEPSNVKAIFNAVASLESILVLDDFDGFSLEKKDATTNEFLLQLEGSGGFNGVAILIVNDPSQVDPTIMNRPGRVDEVHMIGYLNNPLDVIEAIRANYQEPVDLQPEDSSIQFMIDNKFSTSRITGAAEYALAHHGSIDNASMTDATAKMLVFERNATCVVKDGKLTNKKPSNGVPRSNKARSHV